MCFDTSIGAQRKWFPLILGNTREKGKNPLIYLND